MVSIVIPARNEREHIEQCARRPGAGASARMVRGYRWRDRAGRQRYPRFLPVRRASAAERKRERLYAPFMSVPSATPDTWNQVIFK